MYRMYKIETLQIPGNQKNLKPLSYTIIMMNIFKIVVIGNYFVGKTTLINRYTKGFSPEKYIATIGVNITSYKTNIDNDSIDFQIFDIAGHKRFETLRTNFYKNAYGALLLFDLTNSKSLEDVPEWIKESRTYCIENVPIVILGNKMDLKVTIKEEMVKGILDSENISEELYLKTSALYGENVTKSFELLGNLMLETFK